jgi:hypothetical protein
MPCRLNPFPTCTANPFGIVKGISILTVILMVAEMSFRNTPFNPPCNINNVWEPFREAFNAIDGVLAFDIIAVVDPAEQFNLSKNRG